MLKLIALFLLFNAALLGTVAADPVIRPGGSSEVLYAFPTTNGDLSVGRNGENTFSLKIPTFPSYLELGLRAVYNSRGTDGIMGMGWSIPIPRVDLNTSEGITQVSGAFDEEIFSIKSREFVKDRWQSSVIGKMLCERQSTNKRTVSGFACHGQPHTQVRFLPSGDKRAQSWIAKDPLEGVTQYYGENAASRIQSSESNTVSWLLSREVTRHGQEVRYFYDEKLGSDQRILRAILMAGDKVIRFDYKQRKTNRLISFASGARRELEWLLSEIVLQKNCIPQQVVRKKGDDVFTTFDNCDKSDALEKIVLKYRAPTTRYTGRYALHTWQHMSIDESLAFGAVKFRYNGDGNPARGDGINSDSIFRNGTTNFEVPDGYTLISNSGRTAYQNYTDWNRDGLADWISVKQNSSLYWPDPAEPTHKIIVRKRSKTGSFLSPEDFEEPLARYARWVHRPDDGGQTFVYAEPVDDDTKIRIPVDDSNLGSVIMSGTWPDVHIGIRADPWMFSPLAKEKSEPIFKSLSMTVDCEKLGSITCGRIKRSYRIGWDEHFGDDHDSIGVKLTDLTDINGDGYLDRVLSGLLVIWDPLAPDADANGIRDPLTGRPAIYVSRFDPVADDFLPFERYEIPRRNTEMVALGAPFLSALAITVKKNSDVGPTDLSNQTTARSLVAAAGLAIQGHSVVRQLAPQNASSTSPASGKNSSRSGGLSNASSLIGLGLTAASIVANHSKADPEIVADLAYAKLTHSGATGAYSAVESAKAAADGVGGLSKVAGWASFTNAIVGTVAQTVSLAWQAQTKRRITKPGFNASAVVSNTKTGTSIISIVAATTGIATTILLIAAAGISSVNPVGLVAGIVLSVAGIILSLITLFSVEGGFETRNGPVSYNFRTLRGVVYAPASHPTHASEQSKILDWTDITGDRIPDLVIGKYTRRNAGFAVSPGVNFADIDVAKTKSWRQWVLPAGVSNTFGPKALSRSDLDTEYERGDVHRGDQIDGEIAMLDINGDGLIDLVDAKNSQQVFGFEAYLNTGTGFQEKKIFNIDFASLPSGCSARPKLSRSRSLSWTESINRRKGYAISLNNVTQMLGPDLDNNGLPDLVIKDEKKYPAIQSGGGCVRTTNARMCDSVLPVNPEPNDQNCTAAKNTWYAAHDGFGNKTGFNEGDSHLSQAAHAIFSPDASTTHHVAFNTGQGFTPFVEITDKLPSLGGGLNVISITNTANNVPELAMGGTTNALMDADASGVANLVSMQIDNLEVKELSGSHPMNSVFEVGIKNPDAMNQLTFPEGGQVEFDYRIKRDVNGQQGSPLWVLDRVEFDDKIGEAFASNHGWNYTKPYVTYKYSGAKLHNREFLGFEAITENRFNGNSLAQIVQVFSQSGPQRGSLKCSEVRGKTSDNLTPLHGSTPETPICVPSAYDTQDDRLGVDISLSEDQPAVYKASCLANFETRFQSHLLPLLQRVTNNYDTTGSLFQTTPEGSRVEIRRVANLSLSRTETFNSSNKHSWRQIDVSYNPFPHYTPKLSVATTNEGHTRTLSTEWKHHDEEWYFHKTAEEKRNSANITVLRTNFDYEIKMPFNLVSISESDGIETRTTIHSQYNSGGQAERVSENGIVKEYSYFGDFEDGTGLLKTSTRLVDEFQEASALARYTYDPLGRVLSHTNLYGGVNTHQFDKLGLPSVDLFAGRNRRTYQYSDTGLIDFSRSDTSVLATQRTTRVDNVDDQQIRNITWWDGFMRPFRVGKKTEGHQAIDFHFRGRKTPDHNILFGRDVGWFRDRNATVLLQDFRLDASGNKQCSSQHYLSGSKPKIFSTALIDVLGRPHYSQDYKGHSQLFQFSVNGDDQQQLTVTDDMGFVRTQTFDAYGRGIKTNYGGGQSRSIAYSSWDAENRYTDGEGNVTIIETNGWNQPVKICQNPRRLRSPANNVCPGDWPAMAVTRDLTGEINKITDFEGNVTEIENSDCRLPGRIMPPVTERESKTSGATTYKYNSACDTVEVVNADGSKIKFSYNDAGQKISEEFHGPGLKPITYSFGYDGLGRLRYRSNGLGRREYQLHDFRDLVVEKWFGKNRKETREFGVSGNLMSQTSAMGIETRFESDLMNKVTAQEQDVHICDPVRLSAGDFGTIDAIATTQYQYDSRGRLKNHISPDGSRQSFEYNSMGQVTNKYPTSLADKSKIATAARTEIKYDRAGRVKSVRNPVGVVFENVYDGAGELVQRIVIGKKGDRLQTKFERDRQGRIKKITPPYDETENSCRLPDVEGDDYATEIRYTPMGKVERISGPADKDGVRDIRVFEYDHSSRVKRLSINTNQSITYTYDGLGRPERVKNSEGHSETRTYHPNGMVSQLSDHNDRHISLHYDAFNQPSTVTDNREVTSVTSFDKDGKQIALGTAENSSRWIGTKKTLGPRGLPERISVASYNNSRRPGYGDWNAKVEGQICYDIAGRPQATLDANGHRIRYNYDNRGRLVRTHQTAAAGAAEERNRFNYTNNNELSRHRSRIGRTSKVNNITKFDQFGRIQSVKYSLSGLTQSYTYDASGNVCTITDATADREIRNTNILYDPRHRPLRIKIRGDTEQNVKYTSDGLIESVVDGSGRWDYEYNKNGKLTLQKQTVDSIGLTFITRYRYDKSGVIEEIVLPAILQGADANRIKFQRYDDSALVRDILWNGEALAQSITYDGLRRVTSWTMAELISHEYAYNDFGHLQSQRAHTLGNDYQHVKLEYDDSGLLVSIKDILDPNYDVDLKLDTRNRIEKESIPVLGNETHFRWDNQDMPVVRINPNGSITDFQYTQSGLLEIVTSGNSKFEIDHDGFGNRTRDETNRRSMMFDKRDRLTHISDQRGTSLKIDYDHQGRVVRMGNTVFLYAIGAKPTRELTLNDANQITAVHTNAYLGGRLIMRENESRDTRSYFVNDHKGSPVLEIDESGGIIAARQFSSFGNVIPRQRAGSPNFSTNIGFHGAYYIPGTKLSIFHHRIYDPDTLSFLSADPAYQLNLEPAYSFANANPQYYSDKDGLEPVGASPTTNLPMSEREGPIDLISGMRLPPGTENPMAALRGTLRSLNSHLVPLLDQQTYVNASNSVSDAIGRSSVGHFYEAGKYAVLSDQQGMLQNYQAEKELYDAFGRSMESGVRQVPSDAYNLGAGIVDGTVQGVTDVKNLFWTSGKMAGALAVGDEALIEAVSEEHTNNVIKVGAQVAAVVLIKRAFPGKVGRSGKRKALVDDATPENAGHYGNSGVHVNNALPAMVRARQRVWDARAQVVEDVDGVWWWGENMAEARRRQILNGIEPLNISAHGGLRRGAGEVTMPNGTSVEIFTKRGTKIDIHKSGYAELGLVPPVETIHPGNPIPNYTLTSLVDGKVLPAPRSPHAMTIYPGHAVTMDQILRPNMGVIRLVVCLVDC